MNNCITKRVLVYSGFDLPWLSEAAVKRLRELGWPPSFHPDDPRFSDDESCVGMLLVGEIDRDGGTANAIYSPLDRKHREHPLVLQVFDELGSRIMVDDFGISEYPDAQDEWPRVLVAIDIPADVEYEIEQNEGGWEYIREVSRVWRIQRKFL